MNPYFPIYTGDSECRDCYKCVRMCPSKAIRIENSKASVINERCIICGLCVKVCPPGAKHVRDDINRAKRLLTLKEKVFVSLAPSFASEFGDTEPSQLILALKKLGFHGVSETALGAQEVSAHVARKLGEYSNSVLISSACPTVVELVTKYYPQHSSSITDFFSPALAHAKMLRREFGDNIAVVFIGPCISKKKESDNHPDLINVSLTFRELREWLNQEDIKPEVLRPDNHNAFIPEQSGSGALYPVDGGMIAGIKSNCPVNDISFMAFSGIDEIRSALESIDTIKPEGNLFLELLACRGGCVNGPESDTDGATALKRYKIIRSTDYGRDLVPGTPQLSISNVYPPQPVKDKEYSDKEIRETLQRVGKYSPKDELNCGGCGYDSCNEFAEALLDEKAETDMCVTHLRNLSQKKANALLNTMPSGVVIVDSEMKIVECNRRFASFSGPETELAFDVKPGMEGAQLGKLIPFTEYFKRVLKTGHDLIDINIRHNNTIVVASIFSIEEKRIAGGIFHDITEPSVQKEQIIKRTKEVIEKNLTTVQKIAYLLGENASETEVILDSIIKSFSPDSGESL